MYSEAQAQPSLHDHQRELSPEHPLRTMNPADIPLPIAKSYESIMRTIDDNDISIVVVGTGGGKTVGLPLMYLHHHPDASIVVTQPRNAPVKLIAQHTANLAGDKVGELIGVRYRDNPHFSEKTQILYEMEQSLINDLIEDPLLTKYNTIILDEIHEGGARLQMLMPLLQYAQVIRKANDLPALKIIATSATLDAEGLKKSLQETSPDQKIDLIEVPGGTPHTIDRDHWGPDYHPDEMPDKAAELAKKILDEEEKRGDMLIFLAGKSDITKTKKKLLELGIPQDSVEFHTLHSGTTQRQKDALAHKTNDGKRYIILSTTSGETGVTFEKLTDVIDTGLKKETRIDPATGMDYLERVKHSYSGCIQREGRVGRTQNGRAWHLYSEEDLEKRKATHRYTESEIHNADLTGYLLELARIQASVAKHFAPLEKIYPTYDVRRFPFLENPPREHIEKAIASLTLLGAFDKNGKITPLGQEMAAMQTDPHYARMIVEGKRTGAGHTMANLAALLENSESVLRDRAQRYKQWVVPGSDMMTLLRIYREYHKQEDKSSWAKHHGFDEYVFQKIEKRSRELIGRESPDTATDDETIGRAIAAGFLDRIIEKTGVSSYTFLANPHAANISVDSYSEAIGSPAKFLAIGSIRKDGKILARLCRRIPIGSRLRPHTRNRRITKTRKRNTRAFFLK